MLVSYLGEYDAKTSVSGNGFVQWHRHVTENRPFRQFAEKATTSVHPKRFVDTSKAWSSLPHHKSKAGVWAALREEAKAQAV